MPNNIANGINSVENIKKTKIQIVYQKGYKRNHLNTVKIFNKVERYFSNSSHQCDIQLEIQQAIKKMHCNL